MKWLSGLFLILTLMLPAKVFGRTAIVKRNTGVYKVSNRKLKRVGTLKSGQRLRVVGKSKSRKWLKVLYRGRKSLVRRNKVRILKRRSVSSTSYARTKKLPNKKLILTAGPSFQTASFGIGLGGGASYAVADKISGITRNPFELGLYGYFYPSVGSGQVSGTALSFSALAKTTFIGTQTKGIGVEAGLSWMRTAVSVDAFPGLSVTETSASASSFGFTFGPTGRYPLAKSIYLDGGIRVHIMSGSAVQLYVGAAFGL